MKVIGVGMSGHAAMFQPEHHKTDFDKICYEGCHSEFIVLDFL